MQHQEDSLMFKYCTVHFTHSKKGAISLGDTISWNHHWVYESPLAKVLLFMNILAMNILAIILISYKTSSQRIRFCSKNIQNGQWIISRKKKKTLSESNQMDIWQSIRQFWRGYTDYSTFPWYLNSFVFSTSLQLIFSFIENFFHTIYFHHRFSSPRSSQILLSTSSTQLPTISLL